MKILHLSRSYLPNRGGVETHLAEVNKNLLKLGHQVQVLTLSNKKNLPERSWGYKLQIWQEVWRQRQHFLEADIVQVHDVFWWLLPIYPLVIGKVFTTFHGWEGQYPVRWQAKLQRLVYNWLSKRTIHVGGWIREFYWDRPTAVTYGGVDESLTDENDSKKSSAKNSKKVQLVFVGRLEAENDLELYLELIKNLKENLKKQKEELVITWVGDGSYKSRCQKLGRVTGLVEDVTPYLKQADLVLAASYLSILQAQALGKVVCGFYSHLLKERYLKTFPGNKFMVVGNDPTKMADSILKILKNRNKKLTLEKNARKFAKEQTWSKVTQVYLKLWQEK